MASKQQKYFFTPEQEKYIVDNYERKTSKNLATMLDVPQSAITNLWHKHGLHGKASRVFPINNEHYFDVIDTPQKAYYLGFIASDGCLHNPHQTNKQKIIRICIAATDIDILYTFRDEIKTEKTIRPYKYNGHEYVAIEISSDIMYDAIIKSGISPERKTYGNTIAHNIDDSLFKYFILGYFDGDGSFVRSKIGGMSTADVGISISGYKDNMDQMINYLAKYNIYTSFVPDKRKYGSGSGEFGYLTVTNKICKYSFLKFLYDSNCTCLERKRLLALDFINLIENDQSNMGKVAVAYYNNAVCNIG